MQPPPDVTVEAAGFEILNDSPTLQSRQKNANQKVIAYAISLTECQPHNPHNPYLDQAAVLHYSIHQHSIRNPNSGSKYDYKAYAFIHPDASNCTEMIERIGYQVSIRESPVLKRDIIGPLKRYVHDASCCQEKEFLKLYSYTLVDHAAVLHLDLDCLILQKLDDLFDTMLEGRTAAVRTQLQLQWDQNYTSTALGANHMEAFFTRDYNMVYPGDRLPHQIGVQGGFLFVKPDLEVFQMYKATIIRGNYEPANGWGGKLQYGGYYGAAQIQGLCSYFYGAIRPDRAVELNRCYYNFMGDKPRDPTTDDKCYTLEEDCQDCRTVPFEEIKSIHFTKCSKPWWCHAHPTVSNRTYLLGGPAEETICLEAHKKWFQTRSLLEQVWSERDPDYYWVWQGEMEDTTYGHCDEFHGYITMKFPKTKIVLSF